MELAGGAVERLADRDRHTRELRRRFTHLARLLAAGRRRGLLGDIGSLAPADLDQTRFPKLLVSLRDRRRVYAKVARHLAYGRQLRPRRQRAGGHHAADGVLDLLPERDGVGGIDAKHCIAVIVQRNGDVKGRPAPRPPPSGSRPTARPPRRGPEIPPHALSLIHISE